MDANRGKIDSKSTAQLYTSLGCLNELRYVGVAWIEARVGVDDSDDWPG